MSGSRISILKENAKNEAYQDKGKSRSEPDAFADSSIYRFPSVESVLDDIDAFLKTHDYVA